MTYGSQIGAKFDRGGAALNYPGNTVISDVTRESPAFAALTSARGEIARSGVGGYFIFLPGDSYHMTVIRGLNGGVRKSGFWPKPLPMDCTMPQADDYVEKAVLSVKSTGAIRMRFCSARATDEDLRVELCPAGAEQARELKRYRDEVADALGLRLRGHDEYTYHITLGYTRYVAFGDMREALSRALERANGLLSRCGEFTLEAPHVAFYRDMLSFHREKIER